MSFNNKFLKIVRFVVVIVFGVYNLFTCLILGGNGYINDYPAGRFLRDAKLYEIGAGTSEVRRMLIGRALNKEYSWWQFIWISKLYLLYHTITRYLLLYIFVLKIYEFDSSFYWCSALKSQLMFDIFTTFGFLLTVLHYKRIFIAK